MPPKKAAAPVSTLEKSQIAQNVEKEVAARLEEARARFQGGGKASNATPATTKKPPTTTSSRLSTAAMPTVASAAKATPSAKGGRAKPVATPSAAETLRSRAAPTRGSSTKPAASATSTARTVRRPSITANIAKKDAVVSGIKRRRPVKTSVSPEPDADMYSESDTSDTSQEEPGQKKRRPAAKRAKTAAATLLANDQLDTTDDEAVPIPPAHVPANAHQVDTGSVVSGLATVYTPGRLVAVDQEHDQEVSTVRTPPQSTRSRAPDSDIRWGGEASPPSVAVISDPMVDRQERSASRKSTNGVTIPVQPIRHSEAYRTSVASGQPIMVRGGATPRDGTVARRRSVLGTTATMPSSGADKLERRATGRSASSGFEVATTFNRFACMRTAVFSAGVVLLSVCVLYMAFLSRDSPTEQCAAVAHRLIRDRAGNVLCGIGIPASPLFDTEEVLRQVRERAPHLAEHACESYELIEQELTKRGAEKLLNDEWTVPTNLANRPYLCILNQALLSLPAQLWYLVATVSAIAWQYPILSAVAISALVLGAKQWNKSVDKKLQKHLRFVTLRVLRNLEPGIPTNLLVANVKSQLAQSLQTAAPNRVDTAIRTAIASLSAPGGALTKRFEPDVGESVFWAPSVVEGFMVATPLQDEKPPAVDGLGMAAVQVVANAVTQVLSPAPKQDLRGRFNELETDRRPTLHRFHGR